MFSGVVVLLFVIQWDACGAVCVLGWVGRWGVGVGGAAAVLSVGDSLSVATAPGSV